MLVKLLTAAFHLLRRTSPLLVLYTKIVRWQSWLDIHVSTAHLEIFPEIKCKLNGELSSAIGGRPVAGAASGVALELC